MGTRSAAAGHGLWLVVAGAAVVAAGLGVIGFVAYLPTRAAFAAATPADIAYYTAQLFVLGPVPLDVPGPFPTALEIARFLAPATTVLVVVETVRVLVRDRVRRWAASHAKGHVVVTGNEPVALMLARRFAAEGTRVVLVSDTAGQDVGRRHDLFVVPGDPADETTLRAAGAPRAATVYACGADSTTNLAVALTTRRITERPVTVQVKMRDAQLFADLTAARHTLGSAAGGDLQVRLSFFVIEDLAARALLAQESLVPDHDEAGAVVLGDGAFGRAVVRQFARRQDPARPASVTLIADADATAWVPPAGALGFRLYICLADLDLALRTALDQTRRGRRRVVLCLQQRSTLQDALSGTGGGLFDGAAGPLAVFGVLDAACDAAPRDQVDEIGRAIHDRYLASRLAAGETPATNASLVPWGRLPMHLKRSNWAQAAHIGAKLAMIGGVIVPAVDGAEPFEFRSGEVDMLAELEHERWVAERRAAGFEYGPVRVGNRHPDLLDWADLPQAARDKDVDVVEHLPAVLEQAGFQILRL
ncbi:MAG TPA: NAD-binding protein [Pseudonocardiaceae bacterium]